MCLTKTCDLDVLLPSPFYFKPCLALSPERSDEEPPDYFVLELRSPRDCWVFVSSSVFDPSPLTLNLVTETTLRRLLDFGPTVYSLSFKSPIRS